MISILKAGEPFINRIHMSSREKILYYFEKSLLIPPYYKFTWRKYERDINYFFKHKFLNHYQLPDFWKFVNQYEQFMIHQLQKQNVEALSKANIHKLESVFTKSSLLINILLSVYQILIDYKFKFLPEYKFELLFVFICYIDFIVKEYDKKHTKIIKSKSELPIYLHKDAFIDTLQQKDVIVLAGDTGCGKSTQIPQYLLEYGLKNIVCTQPRRIACISLCKRVSYEVQYSSNMLNYLNSTLGDALYVETDNNSPSIVIGYQIRFDKTTFHQNYDKRDAAYNIVNDEFDNMNPNITSTHQQNSNKQQLLFMTEGILLRQLGSLDENTTTEILPSQIFKHLALNKYDCILIDEVHERHCTTDFILGALKCLLHQYWSRNEKPPFKLILMSATINTQLFVDFFTPHCGFLQVPGRLFPIELIYIPLNEEDMISSRTTLDQAENINLGKENKRQNTTIAKKAEQTTKPEPYVKLLRLIDSKYGSPYDERGDVLIFLPGVQEIHNVKTALEEYSVNSCPENVTNDDASSLTKGVKSSGHWLILPLHASLASKEQDKVFDLTPPGYRKCVLATNVAETSVTIDGIRFVVDSGKVKELYYDPITKMSRLKTFWVSKAGAEQRKGRAGRTGPGVCFRLYDMQKHMNGIFKDFSASEIVKSPLHSIILQILLTVPYIGLQSNDGWIDIRKFPFIEPPEDATFDSSIAYLAQHGALLIREKRMDSTILTGQQQLENQNDILKENATELNSNLLGYELKLTTFGELLARLPLDVTIAKMLINAYFLSTATKRTQLIEVTLTLCAIFSVRSIYNSKAYNDMRTYNVRKEFQANEHGDPFTLWNLFNHWIKLKIENMKSDERYNHSSEYNRKSNESDKHGQGNRENNAKRWCRKAGMEEQRLYEVLKLRKQFDSIMKREFSEKKITRVAMKPNNTDSEEDSGQEKPEENVDNDIIRHQNKTKRYVKRLKHERLDKSGKVKFLKVTEKSTFGKNYYADSDEEKAESSDQFDSDIDIEDIELRLLKNKEEIKKLYIPSLSNHEIDLVKYILLSGFYPQLAIPDQFNTFKQGSDLIYHTKEKPYVLMHPTSTLTYEPDLFLARSKWSNTILLSFSTLLETSSTKPYLINTFTLVDPLPQLLLQCGCITLAIKQNDSLAYVIDILFDNWLSLTLTLNDLQQVFESMENIVKALAIRYMVDCIRWKKLSKLKKISLSEETAQDNETQIMRKTIDDLPINIDKITKLISNFLTRTESSALASIYTLKKIGGYTFRPTNTRVFIEEQLENSHNVSLNKEHKKDYHQMFTKLILQQNRGEKDTLIMKKNEIHQGNIDKCMTQLFPYFTAQDLSFINHLQMEDLDTFKQMTCNICHKTILNCSFTDSLTTPERLKENVILANIYKLFLLHQIGCYIKNICELSEISFKPRESNSPIPIDKPLDHELETEDLDEDMKYFCPICSADIKIKTKMDILRHKRSHQP